jgi:ankyrin repeat protein
MQILSPPRLIRTIDIADRATSVRQVENHLHGALVSIDLDCSENLFYGHKNLVVKFCLSFTTRHQDGFHKSVAIKKAKVGYFRPDNDIRKMITAASQPTPPGIEGHNMFKEGRVEVKMQQVQGVSSIRIVVLLDAYPSNMELSAHLSTPPTPNEVAQPSRAFMSASRAFNASSPDDERLQRLLCWTAALGYKKLFAAYLDQGPSVLIMEDELGWTPFSLAAFSGRGSVIQLALQRGGTLSSRKKTAKGPSPLEAAARSQDPNIFNTFLKTLKYLKDLESDLPEKLPKPDNLPELTDNELEEELEGAVSGEQMSTVRRLVELLQPEEDRAKANWLAQRMVQAAAGGDLCLVQVLKSRGADVNCKVPGGTRGRPDAQFNRAGGQTTTPLMEAIWNDMVHVAEFLIIHGAEDDEALRTAVRKKQHNTIRALLHAGTPVTEAARQELINIASAEKDSTTLMLLKLEKGTGKLATYNNLHRDVDELFEATVVDFYDNKPPTFEELTVDALMQKRENYFERNETSFKWFHLPANNVRYSIFQSSIVRFVLITLIIDEVGGGGFPNLLHEKTPSVVTLRK